jgi:hypothetical protein
MRVDPKDLFECCFWSQSFENEKPRSSGGQIMEPCPHQNSSHCDLVKRLKEEIQELKDHFAQVRILSTTKITIRLSDQGTIAGCAKKRGADCRAAKALYRQRRDLLKRLRQQNQGCLSDHSRQSW